ncbi:MAG: hypothetical protein OEQ18_00485 [Gammaproteobacteria bacterium]|nr:hypothetical protein [Gammaproteobacteria bacterium]
MNKTRYSLFYLATYLLILGFGLLLVPRTTLQMLQATGEYGDIFPRIAGMLMSGLGMTVIGIIRSQVAELYPATLFIRIYFLICIGVFYVRTGDPLFVVMAVIVSIGFVLTLGSFLADRSKAA